MHGVIIIGGTSGIGKELAYLFHRNGYSVGITGRRIEILNSIKTELADNIFVRKMDLTQAEESIESLQRLFETMGNVNIVVVSAGIGYLNEELKWTLEKDTIDTNVLGFTAIASTAINYFIKCGKGHLVGISSIAALRGSRTAPAYNASKAFISNYLEGLRQKVSRLNLPITVSDIKPGFVDTKMAQGEGLFWVASVQKAAKQIYTAIKKCKTHVYITKRWRFIAWLLKFMPSRFYNKV